MAAVLMLSLGLGLPALAQESGNGLAGLAVLQERLDRCEATVDSLLQERVRIRRESDALAAERDRVQEIGARDEELSYLGRLADLSAEEDRLSGLLRQQQAACEQRAEDLQAAIQAALDDSGAAWPVAALDSLRRRQTLLEGRNQPSGRIDVSLPRAQAQDGPEDLIYRAQLARDLADRLRRWAHYVGLQVRALEEEARLQAELSDLLQDEELFGDGFVQGSDAAAGGPVSWRSAAWGPGALEQITSLKAQAGIEGEAWTASGLLDALAEWLQLKRAALLARADELEQEAERRGGRPEVE